MPVSMTALLGASSETDASSYDTASYTPSANKLIIAAIVNDVGTGPPNTPTLSGNGLTWVQINTVQFNDIATPLAGLTLFRAMDASPSTGALTIAFAGQTQRRVGWSVVEFGSVDTGGTSGSAAVVQSAINVSDSTSALTVTLAAFGSADNATYGAFGRNEAEVISPGAGFTEIHDFQVGSGVYREQTEWRTTNDTTVDASGATATRCAGIAIEIKFAATTHAAAAALSAAVTVAPGALLTFAGAVALPMTVSLAANTMIQHAAAAALDTAVMLTALGGFSFAGAAVLATSVSIAPLAGLQQAGGAVLPAAATLTVFGAIQYAAAAALATSASLTADASKLLLGAAALSAAVTLAAVGGVIEPPHGHGALREAGILLRDGARQLRDGTLELRRGDRGLRDAGPGLRDV